MSQRVALVGAVALAIWEILQDRRNRVLFGIVRQPDAGRQRRSVLQRYQGVLDNTHRLWEIRDNHSGLLMMAAVLPACCGIGRKYTVKTPVTRRADWKAYSSRTLPDRGQGSFWRETCRGTSVICFAMRPLEGPIRSRRRDAPRKRRSKGRPRPHP